MRLFAGIDIGGTNIKYGVIEEEGNIIKSSERSTEAHKGGMSIIDKVKEIIREMNKEYKIEGICVSTAGMVCPKEGKIVYAGPTIPNYTGVEIKKILEKEFNIKCEVENDVNCAALGELWLGAGKGKESMACMTIGTGIGGAIIADGKIIPGFSNSAGEIGYMLVNGEQIQNIASTTALVRSVANRKGIDENDINGKEIFKGYEEGDSICIDEIEKLADTLALGITNIVYLFNPEVVVLGGGIMAREDILRPLIDKSLKKYLIESVYNNTNIAFAELKNTAGMMGAVYNFKNRELM
ncbi:ROK family protein [Eubacterium multiforme]|uniref:NBD/HSP70 family sugar kinase n=1 Tax=Eubacterium multiforme TaxID=83339 RepID=A0ABT9UWD0_9FIRM|nr:ROK family protein [Eubacterium multiforme]MDQ0150619.1 putative NBD/HSP70 family sugar kinase [Eubacterium multiforme]